MGACAGNIPPGIRTRVLSRFCVVRAFSALRERSVRHDKQLSRMCVRYLIDVVISWICSVGKNLRWFSFESGEWSGLFWCFVCRAEKMFYVEMQY